MEHKYDCLLLDVDDTLLDFKACAKGALLKTFQDFSMESLFSDQVFEIYHAISNSLWEELNLGHLKRTQIFERRFPTFFDRVGITCDAGAFEPAYRKNLCQEHAPMEGLMLVLPYLASKYRLFTASNGMRIAQITRLADSGITPFLEKSFISEEIGFEKPDLRFYQTIFEYLEEVDHKRILMIGDSLSADIAGGNNAGIDTCYFNRTGKPVPENVRITFEITTLLELCTIL